MKTIDAARNHWESILKRLGVNESFLKNKHGPCPMCGGEDRFRFDNKGGNGSWICNQCGSGNGINLLMQFHGWEFSRAAKEVDSIVGNCSEDDKSEKPKTDPRERLRKVQEKLKPLDGINPVSIYLKNRGLQKCNALKYHPSISYYEDGAYLGTYPAMVAVFASAAGKPLTFHITHLTKEGTKAPVKSCKKVLTPISKLEGGAIRLCDPARIMGIAEGIETALACFEDQGIPTWAAYCASVLEKFEPPQECEHLVIFADNDENFTGQRAAFILANRLAVRGLSVEVRIPDKAGTDFADRQAFQARLDRLSN